MAFDDDVMAACSLPSMRPRRELRSPIRSPNTDPARRPSTCMTGSRREGRACFMGLLERKRAGDSERHIRGIDVVILAVIEGGAGKSGHRETGEIAARGGFAMPRSTEGNPVVSESRRRKRSSTNSMPLFAFGGLELDAATHRTGRARRRTVSCACLRRRALPRIGPDRDLWRLAR